MSSVAAPFGMRPVFKSGGTPASLNMRGTIASGYATSIGEGDPVKLLAGNLIRAGGTNGTDTTGGIVGAFMGVEYLDSTGKPVESNQWIASTVATNIVAYYVADPYATYEVQANGSLAAVSLGQEIDFVAGSLGPASALTGLSGGSVDTATLSSGAQRLLRIVGLSPAADNIFGDAFTNVLVQVAKHQFVTPVIGIA